ncbi:unnamed protein product [Lactuca saligna]|uniref:Retrotransposon Copia-like N-terminal domain-containing protein n=1 Tax=Lactuca saligna TaxID=75948 RepID=A0AA35YKF0_LACSI|nr:unnamed protein product [Lactuca saligna]
MDRKKKKKKTKMESSVGEKYSNPSHICALNFTTFNSKLSGRDNYGLWKIQMLVCLLDSHHINGKPVTPQTSFTCKRSDALVKVWIFGSLYEHAVWLLKDPIIEATSQNANHGSFFPNAIWSANKDGHNIIQYNVYNLLYQIVGQKSTSLQIQRELQWFKEVENFACSLEITYEIPQMVFTREHKDLMIEGEKWMKTSNDIYKRTQ